MFKNTASQKLTMLAIDTSTNAPKTGDAANLTAYVSKDDGSVTVLGDTSATELDATNAPGLYSFDLTQAETNADKLLFSGKSSTSNVKLIPILLYTVPASFTSFVTPTGAAVNATQIGGTSQTGRDIGASVLLSPGTGTGQISLSSGAVLLQATQTGVTIPTVTTLTNAPSDSSGITTLLSRLSSARAGYLDNLSAGAVALASTFTGITSLAQWLGLIAGKQTGNSTARTELRASGAGSGTFDETTDSQEAIRDNMGTAQTGDSYARLGAPAGASVSADVAAVKTDTGNLVTRITSTLFSGITSLAHWLGAMAGKQTPNSTAQTELRASGAGSGTFDATTDSLEAIKDTASAPSAATIADAVWDEAQSGHTSNGTFGKYLDAAISGVSTGGVSAADIADAVLDEALSGHTTGGTLGKAVADILEDTGTTLQGELDGIQADTEDLQSKLGTPSNLGGGATIAQNLSDIEAQTDDIGAAGAGLTALATAAELAKVPKSDGSATWNSTALASLQQEAADALNAYDPPTNAEMVAAIPTTAQVADKVLGRNLAGGSDGGRTVQDALRFSRNKFTIIAGVLTVYAEDDTTPAWTANVTTTAGDPVSASDPA